MWLIALRYAAGCMVWSSVAFVIVLCIVMTVFSFSKAGFIGVSDLQAMTGSTAEEMEGRWSLQCGFCWSLIIRASTPIEIHRNRIGARWEESLPFIFECLY